MFREMTAVVKSEEEYLNSFAMYSGMVEYYKGLIPD